MHNEHSTREANGERLSQQAFLYANGELGPDESAAFERRLGEDQTAREALCQAVQLSLALTQQIPARPDPAYRERVREQLRRRSRWTWLFGRRTYRGHPAVWSAVGAVAAVLLVLALTHLQGALVTQPHPPLPEPRPVEEEVVPAPIVEPPQLAATEDIATVWADLHDTNRVTKAHDEEMRRKMRNEDRSRLTKPGDRKTRPLSNQAPR